MKRVLFIAHRVPYPPDKGERLRAFHELRALAGQFRLTLAALAHGGQDLAAAGPLGQYCEKVLVAPAGGKAGLLRGAAGLLAGRSVTEGYFASRRFLFYFFSDPASRHIQEGLESGREVPIVARRAHDAVSRGSRRRSRSLPRS